MCLAPTLAFLLALAVGTSAAQTTIPGDIVVLPGETLVIAQDSTYTGSLTVGAGATIVAGSGVRIGFDPGATLVVNGTAAEPVMFFPSSGTWDGLLFDRSTAEITHAAIMDVRNRAIDSIATDVSLSNVQIFDSVNAPPADQQVRICIRTQVGGTLTIDRSRIGPYRGRNASTGGTGQVGGTGGTVFGIDADFLDALSITRTEFVGIQGGNGGTGGRGANGSRGDNATGNGERGEDGEPGGDGGTGGTGGGTTVVLATNSDNVFIAQNIINRISGGEPGRGGDGGNGGRGGDGSDGNSPFIGSGGDGGRGGNGARGGDGGRGGRGGAADIFDIDLLSTEAIIINNTIYEAVAMEGAQGGAAGDGGAGGSGGNGGEGSTFFPDGFDGSNGSGAIDGTPGLIGASGSVNALVIADEAPSGFGARVHNNIFTFVGTGPRRVAVSEDNGIIDITTNVFSGFTTLATGSNIGGLTVLTDTPAFVDPSAGDFSPASPFLIDAADNTLVPAEITTDFLGNPRFMDEPSTPTTGPGGQFAVDFGAIERLGETSGSDCVADVNNDGSVSPADFNAWILAFNNTLPECDQNGDGLCSPADFNAWILNFNNGCE